MTKSDKFLIVFCSLFILILGSLIFILPQKSFSESENRYLTRLEAPSVEETLSGAFAKNLSSFYSDQFPMRKIFTSLYALCEKSLGKREINRVISYGSQLIARSSEEAATDIGIDAIRVESKYTLFEGNSERLSLYYKTDHHLRTKGAYLLYLEACKRLSIAPYPESFFDKQTVCTDFYGTSFARSCLPKFFVTPDSIELYRYEGDEEVKVTVHDTSKVFYGFYDFSKLDTADKYGIFLGGNYAHASVYSDDEKPSLLIFKDSFANAVVPFLSLHFNIDLIDPRYATQSEINKILRENYYDEKIVIADNALTLGFHPN